MVRLSELARKELVDLNDGNFWGPAGKADLVIDEHNGSIDSLLLSGSSGFFGIGYTEDVTLPWSSIVKVGKDAIIIDLKAT